ncbi:MAG: methylenetetrahydrofolate reductase [NAD(P)H] [Candidatus Nanopelagicales bacterium]
MAEYGVSALLASGERSFSFEFFPPKTEDAETRLWQALRELEALRPTFVSITYGAGGTTRDRTVRITGEIARETTLTPMGHLTCVGATSDDIHRVMAEYADAGVSSILALRGDPPGGPGAPWESTPGGFDHAEDLIAFVRSLGTFSVGAAAFPEGHPQAPDLDFDARVLARKADAGAEFAITQFFFRARDYITLVDRARAHGCTIPIVAGIMPVTDVAQITRFAQLSGAEFPPELAARFSEIADDPVAVRALGVQVATEMCEELLESGAPGLHFYTLNSSTATREIFEALGSLRA